MDSPAVDIASPRSNHPASPTSQQSPLVLSTARESTATTTADAATAEDDDLDPAAFLKSVRELSEKREREDNERYRKLEEEIEKGRQERLARREERARSISPEKQQHQAETPSALRNNNTNNNNDIHTPSSTLAAFGSPSPLLPIGSASLASMAHNDVPQRNSSVEVPEFKGFGSIKRGSAPSTPNYTQQRMSEPAPKPSPSDAMPTRSNTMKWQQRPTPRGSRPMSMAAPSPARETPTDEPRGPREQVAARAPTSRPLSMAAPSHTREASLDEPQPSRDQIAASLGTRDPAYFRQTADRGLGNAAFRKSKDETANGDDVFAARRGLPGMSRESSLNEERISSPKPESVTSEIPSRFGSIREDSAFSAKPQSVTPETHSRFGSIREDRAFSAKPESVTSETTSRFGSIREDRAFSARSSATPSVSDGKQSSDLPFRTASNRSSATTDINEPSGINRTPTMSASQARLTNTDGRPPSPTKGMGGFVQSALMKRSDSQSKRWSAQPVGGLSRQDSTASARGGLGGLQSSYSMPKLDPPDASSNSEAPSRPTSSSSNLADLATQAHDNGILRPNLPSRLHSRSKSVASNYSTSADLDNGLKSPLGSPSKRFSPNKSSWIESALAKPDSPKVAASRPAQPSWMENIARAKAQRGSTEVVPTLGSPNPSERSRPSSPTKETPFGPALLKRSDSRDMRPEAGSTRSDTPPTKAKHSSLSSRPASLLAQESLQLSERMAAPTTRDETLDYKLETTAGPVPETSEANEKPVPLSFEKSTPLGSQPPKLEATPQKAELKEITPDETEPVQSPPSTSPNLDATPKSPEVTKTSTTNDKTMPPPLSTSTKPLTPKPEPATKPVTDFRSTLRSRPVSKSGSEEQPEFLSKFGTLRKAQRESYVAPDVLKANITRGKRGLTITDGPQKTERKDELRDSLIAKKEQWKQDKDAGIVHERKLSGSPVTVGKPEALAARGLLGRNKSLKGPSQSPEKGRNITPEALRFQKSIREKPKMDSPAPAAQVKAPVADVPTPEVTKASTESHLTKSVTEPARRLPSPVLKQEITTEPLGRTTSLPRADERAASPPAEERRDTYPSVAAPTSKLAARFNPGLANILARGPPTSGGSPSGSRSESPVGMGASSRPAAAAASEPPAEGAPLADVRKGRAKGPKKSKRGTAVQEAKSVEPEAPKQERSFITTEIPSGSLDAPTSPTLATRPSPAIKPSARFGGVSSTASIMAASLGSSQAKPSPSPKERVLSPVSNSTAFAKPSLSPKPSLSGFKTSQTSPAVSPKPSLTGLSTSQTSPAPAVQPLSFSKRAPLDKPAAPLKDDVQPLSSSKRTLPDKPATSLNDDVQSLSFPKRTPSDKPATPLKDAVPEFRGFGSRSGRPTTSATDENKENTDSSSPSVKDAASTWGRKKTYLSTGAPSQIHLPTRRDEEAAMRSASLLASSPGRSPSRPSSSNGLGITSPIASPSPALPPKPAKSSRTVSGQLKEASPNKDSQSLAKLPETEAERLLVDYFGAWPTSTGPHSIDTQAVITNCAQSRLRAKTVRKSIQKVAIDGSVQPLRPQEEYTLFDESVYVCSHTHIPEGGSKSTHVIVWAGGSSTTSNVDAANVVGKSEAKREGSSTQIRLNPQGHEQAELFEALGGILITRRGARENASKQFMLCGRKHLGHIVFDEVDFAPSSLCSAFAYLISFPVTLQETKLYLWKGSACSSEEIGAAKLAAMDLSETGEIVEVDQGAEFSSFLKIFGPGTTKASIPRSPSIWQHKASAPDKFTARLFNIQQSDARAGIFSSMFRRPSWGMRAPASEPGIKAEVKEISPFTQSDLDAEGLYLLDAYGELFLLLGPLFYSLQPENVRNALLAQSLLFASDYVILSASLEDRPAIPKASVVFGGCPEGLQGLFRGWDEEHGLWGLGGLMAGSAIGKGKVGEEVKKAGVVELVRVVCR